MKLFLSLLLLFAATVSSVQAAGAIFIRVKQSNGSAAFTGDSNIPAFPAQDGWFELESCGLGLENEPPLSTGGGSTGKAQPLPFKAVKFPNKASAAFFTSCVSGTHWPEFEIAFTKNIGSAVHRTMTIDLKTVVVTGVGLSGASDGETPTETLSFVYQAFRITFFALDSSTGLFKEVGKSSWNFKTNTANY